jgi:uncharacterized protein (TIGR03437 family)
MSFQSAAQGTISTVAGSGQCCASVDGSAATNAWLTGVSGIAVDKQGNIYITDTASGKIRKVNAAGIISTFAGTGTPGFSGDGGPATSAQLDGSSTFTGIAADASGNVYISDATKGIVRKINSAGIITTIAGNGSPGFAGDNGPATAAQLQDPQGLAVDASGNLYIADNRNNRVRKVNAAGVITTVAGNGNAVASGDGGLATAAAAPGPASVALDAAGNLYIAEGGTDIRKVDTAGKISTVAGQNQVRNFSGDGGPATAAALKNPLGLGVDSSGNLYIADSQNGRVRKVDAAGIITTIAGITGNASSPLGDGGPSTSAYVPVPTGVALDAAGNVYVSSPGAGGRVRKIAMATALSVSPASLSFSFITGGSNPAPQTVSVTSSIGTMSFTAVGSVTSGGSWLSVTSSGSTAPATLTVSVNASGLAAGAYSGAITLTPSGGASQSLAVTLTVTGASAPSFASGSVVNALGYQTTLAPGAVFVIFGGGMGPATLAAGGPDYPSTLAGTSISLTPASGGSPITARMVYTAASQVAGLLPSSITPGTYAMRVTYNGIASAPQNVTVLARSLGIATANSAGTGTVQATIGNVNDGLSLTRLTTGNSSFGGYSWTLTPAHPGDTLVLWGTGGGADAANDTGGTSGDQTAAGNFSVVVSGRSITPAYAGASQGFPGLWQINFTLPSDMAPDCFASVQVSAGGQLSNPVTLPVAPSGQGYCTDPQLSQTALQQLDSGGTVALGGLSVSKLTATSSFQTSASSAVTSTTINSEMASGGVGLYTADEYAAVFSGVKIDACVVNDRTASTATRNPAQPQGYLDLGTRLPMSGPGVPAGAALAIASSNPGPIYSLTLPAGTLGSGGAYTITGSGGAGAGAFSASTNLPANFTVSGWDSLSSIDRAKPLTLNWSGTGADEVVITGSTYATVGKDATNTNIIHNVFFTCQVPAASGSYTIPTSVLSYLLPASIVSTAQASGSGIFSVSAEKLQTLNLPLASGGSAAYSAITGVVAYSKNLSVQ